MTKFIHISIVGILACGTATAQLSCGEAEKAFDRANRMVAYKELTGIADNSAPRATMRELQILNERTKQQMLLTVAMQIGCDPNNFNPIGNSEYVPDGLACATAELRGSVNAPECDISLWKAEKGAE
ncbi:MAG: hypothetical protein ACPH9E_13405 [Hyphomonas sp.]|jgi:hypothetical protein